MLGYSPATILLVDRRVRTQDSFVSALQEAGFTVKEACTGAEALQRVREKPDLVILGPDLPDLTGPEVCRRIKSDPETAAVLVLHLGDPPASDVEGAQELNGYADGYLRQPLESEEVLVQVRALLRLGRTESDLLASRSWLRDILDHAPVVVHVKDLAGRYLIVNRHWEKLFHFRRDWVVGQSLFEVHPRDEAEALHANDLKVLEASTPLEFEEVVPQDDGLHTYLSVKLALRDAEGRPCAICGISTDITARKHAEAALKDSEALYHSLVESLPVCLLRKDVQGRFIFANRAFCAAVKRPLAEVVGRTDLDFYSSELARKYVQDDRRVIETGEVLEDIEEHQDPDGGKTYVQVLKGPLHDARGQVIGVQAIYWDVTARNRAEAELGRTAAEFRVARRIQQKLFPTAMPQVPGLDIAVATFGFDISGASYPADAIGGDYYDFVPLCDGGLGIAIGDVSGHGVGPALLMAEVRAFLRAFAQTQGDVGAILGQMNRVLIPDIDDDRFITLLLARLDPQGRHLSYASAGHQPGYVFDGAGTVKQVLESTSTPLGLFPEDTFPSRGNILLEPGDLILLVTDGVVDARAPDGTAFGKRRMQDVVRLARQLTARQIVEDLYYAVRAFAQNRPQYDDITATVIKVTAARA